MQEINKRNIKLYNGDCLDIMKDIPDKSVDMVLCDLPYGITQNAWDSVIPLGALWQQYERIIKDNGAVVLTAQAPFDKILGCSNLKLFRYEWIWNKKVGTGHLNAKKMPLKQHENVLVFYKKLPTYNPQMIKGTPYLKTSTSDGTNYRKGISGNVTKNNGTRYPKSILEFTNANQKAKLHPTQKPVPLFEYLIRTYTNEGELVLDNCMGSGSTGVAAIKCNRKFIGIELDSTYFDIAEKRINEYIK